MKKLTLSIALVAAILSAKAQDTTCTYFKGKYVYEFDYYMDTVLHRVKQEAKFYDIKIKLGNVLCLDLSDDHKRTRKVIATFSDGQTITQVLKSNDSTAHNLKTQTRVIRKVVDDKRKSLPSRVMRA